MTQPVMPEDHVRQLDAVEPKAPTWRFWFLTVLAFPVAGFAVLYAVFAVRAPVPLAALGLLALEGWLLTRERTVRHMAQRRRNIWVAIGCTTTAVVATIGVVVLFFAALINECAKGC